MGFPEDLRKLGPEACRELLLVLTAPGHTRADLIRQAYEAGKADLVELLILFEEQDWSRLAAIEALRAMTESSS